MNQDARRVFQHMPDNPELLQAIGRVTIAHGQLDRMLQFTIRSLANLPVNGVLNETKYDTSGMLRKRVMKLGRSVLGQGPALGQLQDLIDRCRVATDSRNRLIHGVFGVDENEQPLIHDRDAGWAPQPTVDELHVLKDTIFELYAELQRARFRGGFLALAILNRGQPNP